MLVLAACGMAALLALLPAAGHDQMWLLYAAHLHLHGDSLYGPHIFETNPPLILWLSMVPAALAELTHVPDTALGKLFIVAVEAAIAAVCLHLFRRMRPGLSRATLYALAFVFVTVFAVMPARDFGQRDHLLILFLLPYVFAAAVRAAGQPLPAAMAWSIGTLALAGLVLKPHQILIPIAVEITLLLLPHVRVRVPHPGSARVGHWSSPDQGARNPIRSTLPFLRPEIYALILAGLAFLAAIRAFAPLYFTTVLPLVRDTYWAYHQLTAGQLIGASVQLHLLLLADVALLLTRGRRSASPLLWILLAAGAAATLAYYLQGTGWYYQQLPALSLLALALGLLLLDSAEGLLDTAEGLAEHRALTLPRWTPKAAAALAVAALALTTHFMDYPFTPDRSFPVDTPDPSLFAGLAPGTPVMTLSPTIDSTIQPVFKYHLTLGERYPAFLMLPALLRSEDPRGGPLTRRLSPARLAELDAMQHRFMVEDLDHWRPRLLLVERCSDPAVHCQVLEDRHDDLLAFFLRDPAFRARFAEYRYWRSAGGFDAWARID